MLLVPNTEPVDCVSRSVASDSAHPWIVNPPGFSVRGILLGRILEWIAIPFSRGTSQPRDQTLVSCIAGRFFTTPCSITANKVWQESSE